ncbi:MAG: alpha/beta hydrolase family protein [Planctomycetota bacterium]
MLRTVLRVPGFILVSLTFLSAAALITVAFAGASPSALPAADTPRDEDLGIIDSMWRAEWFDQWYASRHPALVHAPPPPPLSNDAYIRRLDGYRALHPLSLAFDPRLEPSFPDWQTRARDALHTLLFPAEPPHTMPTARLLPGSKDLAEENRLPFRRYILSKYEFESRPGRQVRALLAVPRDLRDGERRPAILALPGHHGSPESCFAMDGLSLGPPFDPGAYLYSYGHLLANAGYVVLVPDTAYCPFTSGSATPDLPTDWTLEGSRVWDAMRAIDVLQTLPEVYPDRIGVFGHSLGGETAMFLAALDTRIKVTVFSGYLHGYDPAQGCPCHVVPGLENLMRYSDVCALVAPRFLLNAEGVVDLGDAARDQARDIRFTFARAGAEESFLQVIHAGGHLFYCGPEVLRSLHEALVPRAPSSYCAASAAISSGDRM